MRRLLLNGSPRGEKSNSRLILSWLAQGISTEAASSAGTSSADLPVLDLAKTAKLEAHKQAFLEAEHVVLALPLYTDSMPGIVKLFFESLASVDAARLKGKSLAFIIQSGFPESIHSEALAKYLARLCARLGCIHAGTIIKGGVEGIRIMPPNMTRKLMENFIRAGRELAADGRFSSSLIEAMARPRTLSPFRQAAFKLLSNTGATNFYWNLMLKKHKAYARRFDAPYGIAKK